MSPEYPGHIPVLKNEVCQLLDPKVGEIWVDCTLGMGGHTRILA
ncbi:MAG: 16S rRNA (cytosine(1402)-N(4))-methyltransferase, partial [Gemmataceae bacterium]|nr:16S rRNA (cytosine(1402)-N(4))-methyltransferase [Gemmataceae bacterium]